MKPIDLFAIFIYFLNDVSGRTKARVELPKIIEFSF